MKDQPPGHMSIELSAVRDQLLGLLNYTTGDGELEAIRELLATIAELDLPPELEAPLGGQPAITFSPVAPSAVEG
jgi:hypothetical protein